MAKHRIKEERARKGMTQKELAERLGMTRQGVSSIENSDSVTTNTLEKVAAALDCSVSSLMPEDKRKGTPEGAPHTHINGTTPLGKRQWLVDILIDLINEGHRVKRPKNGTIDRQLREVIAEKNRSGEDVIINVGKGYFRATEDDGPELREYVSKELHRADEIRAKANKMLETWERRYQ